MPVALVGNIGAFKIHAGPYISYLAGANIKDLKTADLNSNEITGLDATNFHRMDYGLVGGIGVDINNFMIGARYSYGLREIGDSGISGTLTNDSKNSVVQLYIGFGF